MASKLQLKMSCIQALEKIIRIRRVKDIGWKSRNFTNWTQIAVERRMVVSSWCVTHNCRIHISSSSNYNQSSWAKDIVTKLCICVTSNLFGNLFSITVIIDSDHRQRCVRTHYFIVSICLFVCLFVDINAIIFIAKTATCGSN